MLDYLGDLGGLINALRHSFAIIVAPLASFAVNREVLHAIFDPRSRKRKNAMQEKEVKSNPRLGKLD